MPDLFSGDVESRAQAIAQVCWGPGAEIEPERYDGSFLDGKEGSGQGSNGGDLRIGNWQAQFTALINGEFIRTPLVAQDISQMARMPHTTNVGTPAFPGAQRETAIGHPQQCPAAVLLVSSADVPKQGEAYFARGIWRRWPDWRNRYG